MIYLSTVWIHFLPGSRATWAARDWWSHHHPLSRNSDCMGIAPWPASRWSRSMTCHPMPGKKWLTATSWIGQSATKQHLWVRQPFLFTQPCSSHIPTCTLRMMSVSKPVTGFSDSDYIVVTTGTTRHCPVVPLLLGHVPITCEDQTWYGRNKHCISRKV